MVTHFGIMVLKSGRNLIQFGGDEGIGASDPWIKYISPYQDNIFNYATTVHCNEPVLYFSMGR